MDVKDTKIFLENEKEKLLHYRRRSYKKLENKN